MTSRSLNRQEFLVLTLTVGTAALLGCSDNPAPATPAAGGSGGSGTGGGGASATGGGGASTGGGGASATGGGGASTGGGGAATGGGGASTGGGGSGGAATGGGGAATGGGGAGGASGGGGAGGGGGGGMCTADIMVTSSGGHTHTLLVTAAQITAGTEVTILSGMGQGHAHYVKVTAADFTALKAGMEVVKKSCSGGDHEYVLKCGGGGRAPAAPTCTDECGNGNMMAMACP